MMSLSLVALLAVLTVASSVFLMARSGTGRRVLLSLGALAALGGVLLYFVVGTPVGARVGAPLEDLGVAPLAQTTLADGRQLQLHSGVFPSGSGVRWGRFQERLWMASGDVRAQLWFGIRDRNDEQWNSFDLAKVVVMDVEGVVYETIYNTERLSRAGGLFTSELELTGVRVERYPRATSAFRVALYESPERVLAEISVPIPESARETLGSWATAPTAPIQRSGGTEVTIEAVTIHTNQFSFYPEVRERLITGSRRSSQSRSLDPVAIHQEQVVFRMRCASEDNSPDFWRLSEAALVDPMGSFATSMSNGQPGQVPDERGVVEARFSGAHRGAGLWRLETQWVRTGDARFTNSERSESIAITFPESGKFEPVSSEWTVGPTTVSALFVAGPSRLQFEGSEIVAATPTEPGNHMSLSVSSGKGVAEHRDLTLGRRMIALRLDPQPEEGQEIAVFAEADGLDSNVALVEATQLEGGAALYAPATPLKDRAGQPLEAEALEISIVIQEPVTAAFVVNLEAARAASGERPEDKAPAEDSAE